MKRSRILYLHPKTNEGKILALEALSVEYRRYLQSCIDTMIAAHRMSIPRGELLRFFPAEKTLSTNIVIACQQHAVEIISGWTASLYTRKLKSHIKSLAKEKLIDERMKIALFTIGKYSANVASETVPQESLDFYWALLLDPEVSGRSPTVSDRVGMRMSALTGVLGTSEDTSLTLWWVSVSHLGKGKRLQLPLSANPHLASEKDASKGCLIRKDRRGRWRIEVLDKKTPIEGFKIDPASPRVGVDVGLNVMAATSDGLLLGQDIKPKFNALYEKVKAVRSNRQRQGLKENSSRLDALEDKLSGLVKTAAGNAANKLAQRYPGHIFVVEDLDLRGCRGQKRFAYRALHRSLERKAPTLKVNPAYSSQMCPSCGYISRRNRSGTKFQCRSCGRISHADGVGGRNLLGRSEDQQVQLDDHPSEVKALLRKRYRARRRNSSSGELAVTALVASSRRLTTEGSLGDIGTASNAEGKSL